MVAGRLLIAFLAAALVAGCGDDGDAGTASTGAAAPPAATTTATVAPAPPKPRTAPQQSANGVPENAPPTSAEAYTARLVELSEELDEEIDGARTSGDSTEIRRVVGRIEDVVTDWVKRGNGAGGGSNLVAAGQVAVTAVESPLLLDEARRQVAAARAGLGG